MCVIFVARESKPTEEMIEGGYWANNAGAGVAWQEGPYVKWEKGLDLPETKALVERITGPMIVHFRIPTVGGATKQLCHPFPVDKVCSLDLKGKNRDGVLFHNGHWSRWKEFSIDIAAKSPHKLPAGKWSDSRAMAWTAGVCGLGVLDMIDEKIAVMTPKEIHVWGSSNAWSVSDNVLCSNMGWRSMAWRATGQGTANHPNRTVYWTGACHYPHTTRDQQNARENFYHGQIPASLTPRDGVHQGRTGTDSGSTSTEEDGTLPVITQKALPPAREAGSGPATGNSQGAGGYPTESPFEKALKKWNKAKTAYMANQMGKKKYRRAKRAYDQAIMRLQTSSISDQQNAH